MRNKAQMEILGLAIVIVLILMATIFVVRFMALNTPTEIRKGFISSELASNMLNTFLKTAARDCSLITMSELLQDCAQTLGSGVICGDGKNSCAYAKSTAEEIFGNTLDKWKMKYGFLAYVDIDAPLISIGSACTGDKRSKLFPIPTSSGAMYAKLDICE